jgi:hypothetical protein
MNYTVGYIDFETYSLKVSENLYKDISVAAYDLNFTISDIILKKYDILLRNSYIFVCKEERKDSVNTLKLSKDTSLLIKKKDLEIDIHILNEKKGYIYNTNNTNHVYKFFIKKHNDNLILKQDPFEVTQLFDECELIDIKDQNQIPESSEEKVNEEEIVSDIIDKKTTEITFTSKQDLLVLENWLNKNDSFVKELTEKVKKYKVD